MTKGSIWFLKVTKHTPPWPHIENNFDLTHFALVWFYPQRNFSGTGTSKPSTIHITIPPTKTLSSISLMRHRSTTTSKRRFSFSNVTLEILTISAPLEVLKLTCTVPMLHSEASKAHNFTVFNVNLKKEKKKKDSMWHVKKLVCTCLYPFRTWQMSLCRSSLCISWKVRAKLS